MSGALGFRHKIPINAVSKTYSSLLVFESSEVAFFLKLSTCARCSPQAPNSSESPGTSRTEHSDLLEEEEDERSDIKVKKKKKKQKLEIPQARQRVPNVSFEDKTFCWLL